jgi:hypothetical protein
MNSQNTAEVWNEDEVRADDGFIELSEQELRDLIDTGAREGLDMSGEEYLRGLREKTIPRTGPNGYLAHLSMLASLLGY